MKPSDPGSQRTRPSRQELFEAAALLGYQQTLGSTDAAVAASSLNLHELDYHGIALLALNSGSLNADMARELKSRQAMMVANEDFKRRALQELASAFDKKKLQPLLFKGSALAYLIYPQPWLRPRTDSDLLIEPEERASFEEVFTELGYQKLFAIEGELVSYQATYSKALTDKIALNIDLHWRINNRQILANSVSKSQLMERAHSLPELGLLTLCPEDHVLVACLHRLGHHQREERLVWLYDIHLLCQSLTSSQWQLLLDLARSRRLVSLTLDALQTCTEILGTEIPQSAMQELQKDATGKEASAIFLQRDLPEWRLLRHELAALPGFKQRWQWLRESLFPNSDYMRQRMGQNSLLLAHLVRISRGLRRMIKREL